ncbi:hypothetical protein FRB90_004881 [Tulasnella sp. 427]|nr:hypothetical protein FRB90_004881 [Tulasnella sp. 427]
MTSQAVNIEEMRRMILNHCNTQALTSVARVNKTWNLDAEKQIWRSIHGVWLLVRPLRYNKNTPEGSTSLVSDSTLERVQRRRRLIQELSIDMFEHRCAKEEEIEVILIEALLKGNHSPSGIWLFPRLQSLTWTTWNETAIPLLLFLSPTLIELSFQLVEEDFIPVTTDGSSVVDLLAKVSLPELRRLKLHGPVTVVLIARLKAKFKFLRHLEIEFLDVFDFARADLHPLAFFLQCCPLQMLCNLRISASLSLKDLCNLLQAIGASIQGLQILSVQTTQDRIAKQLDSAASEAFIKVINALGACIEMCSLTLVTYFELRVEVQVIRQIASHLKALKHLAILSLGRVAYYQPLGSLEILAKYLPNLQNLELHLSIPPVESMVSLGSSLPACRFHRPLHLSVHFALPGPFRWMVLGLGQSYDGDLEQWEAWRQSVWKYISTLLPLGSTLSRLDRGLQEDWDDLGWAHYLFTTQLRNPEMAFETVAARVGNMEERRRMILSCLSAQALTAAARANTLWNRDFKEIIWHSMHGIQVLTQPVQYVNGSKECSASTIKPWSGYRGAGAWLKSSSDVFRQRYADKKEIEVIFIEALSNGNHSPRGKLEPTDESTADTFTKVIDALGECTELSSLTFITYFSFNVETALVRRIVPNLKALKHFAALSLASNVTSYHDLFALEVLA